MKKQLPLSCVLLSGLCLLAPRVSGVSPLLPYEGQPLVEKAAHVIDGPEANPLKDRTSLRIAFYNIEMFTDGIKDGEDRKEAMAAKQAEGAAAILDGIDADIVVISEIENDRVLGMLNSALQRPYEDAFISEFGSGSGRIEKMNVALLSRYEPESVMEVDFGPLSGKGRPTRGLLRASYDLGDGHFLLLYAAHLKANWGKRDRNYAQRANAMSIMLNDVASLFAKHPDRTWEVMLVGDFNTDPMLPEFSNDPTLKVLPQWIDLWSEHPDKGNIFTVPTRFGDPMREFPPALFDRVLVHPGLTEAPWSASIPSVVEKGTSPDISVRPGAGDHVSDHYPIYIEISK